MSERQQPVGADAADVERGAVAASGARESGSGPPVDVGEVIDGRYELLERLGAGGMGYVFGGRDRRLQRPVAVKVIRSELAENKSMARAGSARSSAGPRSEAHRGDRLLDLGLEGGVRLLSAIAQHAARPGPFSREPSGRGRVDSPSYAQQTGPCARCTAHEGAAAAGRWTRSSSRSPSRQHGGHRRRGKLETLAARSLRRRSVERA